MTRGLTVSGSGSAITVYPREKNTEMLPPLGGTGSRPRIKQDRQMEKLPVMDSARLSKGLAMTSEKLNEAKNGARRLLGCYRVGDANDPEVYVAAVVSVLCRYPSEVISDVTEPATGLPSKLKWLPSISEVRQECDILAARITKREELRRGLEEQFAARDQLAITHQRRG